MAIVERTPWEGGKKGLQLVACIRTARFVLDRPLMDVLWRISMFRYYVFMSVFYKYIILFWRFYLLSDLVLNNKTN